jgi:hypothetical protein
MSTTLKNLFSLQKREHERRARRLIGLDIELLISQPVVFLHMHPTQPDLHATVQLPEEKTTIKLPVIDLVY